MQKHLLLMMVLLATGSSTATASDNATCIKAASRTSACPHQIYRAVQLPNMEKPALRCICITDFLPLLSEPENAEQRLAQHRLKQQFKAELQHDVEPLLQVIRRER
ncbi:hypothetical protein GCM10010919_34010 [Alishewanella longhuensis]|uniref:Secreted protein n=1 Tax=Alishewanella longhuensis TaxID=1091037 RepID=A0ABQ3L7S5_9ALTE|nr:hypothetical protein [Alishewanella longhuensis]GHG77992.1 hypothetical protein GCM10010919_34010 [Alishewanella longhuensis]